MGCCQCPLHCSHDGMPGGGEKGLLATPTMTLYYVVLQYMTAGPGAGMQGYQLPAAGLPSTAWHTTYYVPPTVSHTHHT